MNRNSERIPRSLLRGRRANLKSDKFLNGGRFLAAYFGFCNQSFSRILFAVILIVWFIWSPIAFGSEIYIPPLSAKSGTGLKVPIKIDKVDNLAGIKLVLTYDHKILTYKKASRTELTNSLMHIVNDKKPGILIVVMAGAKGIKGKDFSILSLNFEIKKELKSNHTTQISITECQMMSDKLKKVPCNFKTHPLVILPQK